MLYISNNQLTKESSLFGVSAEYVGDCNPHSFILLSLDTINLD